MFPFTLLQVFWSQRSPSWVSSLLRAPSDLSSTGCSGWPSGFVWVRAPTTAPAAASANQRSPVSHTRQDRNGGKPSSVNFCGNRPVTPHFVIPKWMHPTIPSKRHRDSRIHTDLHWHSGDVAFMQINSSSNTSCAKHQAHTAAKPTDSLIKAIFADSVYTWYYGSHWKYGNLGRIASPCTLK